MVTYVQRLHLGTNGFMQPTSLDVVTMTCMNESMARHVYTSGHINITIVLGEFECVTVAPQQAHCMWSEI